MNLEINQLDIVFSPWVLVDEKNFSLISNDHAYDLGRSLYTHLTEGTLNENQRKEFDFLVKEGLLYGRAKHEKKLHYSELCIRLIKEVTEKSAEMVPNSFIKQIMSGSATREQVIAWIYSMFSFTKSAKIHISAMVEGSRERGESTDVWERFLEEEKSHWKIYTNIFHSLGLDINIELNKKRPNAVREFVDHMIKAAGKSQFHYAALLYYVEQGPGCLELEEDPQFYALVKHYNFRREDVLPLFLHTLLNDNIGHSGLWYEVLSKKDTYEQFEVDTILKDAVRHVELANEMVQAIEHI